MRNIFTCHDWDRAQLLYADPQTFIDAAKLLAELLASMTAFPQDKRVMLFGQVRPDLIERLSTWGSELDDIEHDPDLEDEPDYEHSDDYPEVIQ